MVNRSLMALLLGCAPLLGAPLHGADGIDGEAVALVRDGKAHGVIVTRESPGAGVALAVREVNHWVRRITGTALPVITEGAWDGKTPYIAIGESGLTRRNGWSPDNLGEEEARVVVAKGGIGLLGRESVSKERPGCGVYYAALELVRHSLHARWIWPGESGEVFEPRSTIEVAPGEWTWKPRIPLLRKMRNIADPARAHDRLKAFSLRMDDAARAGFERRYDAQEEWLLRERMGLTAQVSFGPELVPMTFGETFKDWWDKYGVTHPDWFAKPPPGVTQQGGKGVKLNLSNPALQEEIFATWKAAWQKNPARTKFLKLVPNDSRGFDTRPETRAWDDPSTHNLPEQEIWNGSTTILTDRYVHFWNLFARRIREVDPEARVNSLAYRNYRHPPLFEKVEPNVIVSYVGGEGYYPDEARVVAEWKAWSEKGARQKMWRPNLLHAGHGIPYLYSRRLFDDFREIAADGLLGTDFDAMTGNWAGQGLNYYVLAEIHWRPEATYEELAAEYYQAFGPAAEAIGGYLRYFEEVAAQGPRLMKERHLVPYETWGGWWQGHTRLVAVMLTDEVLAKAEAFLKEAEALTKEAAPAYRERVAFIRKGFDHSRLMAQTFRRLGLDDPAKRPDFSLERAALLPLWEARQRLLTELVVPVDWLFFQEQRQFGLWQAFLGTHEESGAIPLRDGWQLRLDPANEGLAAHWERASDGPGWSDVAVARPWREARPDLASGKGDLKVAWYRVRFEVPVLPDTRRRVQLRFGSVDAEAHLWVNGQPVAERSYPHGGNYDSWKESFDVDISNAIRESRDNELLIRVRSEKETGGITGEVSLIVGE